MRPPEDASRDAWMREKRATSNERGIQLGHTPNRASVQTREQRGGSWWKVTRPKREGLPRNSIWPEGKVAKPGRMG